MVRHRRNEWSASECRSVIARLYSRGNLRCNERRPHWQPTCNRLRKRHHIRCHAKALVRHEGSKSAETALNFIEDERDLSFLRKSSDVLQKPGVQNAYSALTLYRLYDHRCDGFTIECCIELRLITLADAHSPCQRTERRPVRRT